MKKWISENDVRKSEKILEQVFSFLDENMAKSVVMTGDIIGCPHEEGIDYPNGETCPTCCYWKDRDRFTHELLH